MYGWDKMVVDLSNAVADRASAFIRTALRFTAADVRQTAVRSIKSGGKKRFSRAWKTSKPGEPPRSHKGTLKNAIRYEQKNALTYLIGPERVGASSALKTLEYGGTGQVRAVFYVNRYVERRRASKRVRKSPEPVRPRAKRPYRVASRSNIRGVTVRDYLYFKNSVAWERATAASAFQAWAARQKTIDVQKVPVAPRPYMRPALAAATTEQKNRARMTRASKF